MGRYVARAGPLVDSNIINSANNAGCEPIVSRSAMQAGDRCDGLSSANRNLGLARRHCRLTSPYSLRRYAPAILRARDRDPRAWSYLPRRLDPQRHRAGDPRRTGGRGAACRCSVRRGTGRGRRKKLKHSSRAGPTGHASTPPLCGGVLACGISPMAGSGSSQAYFLSGPLLFSLVGGTIPFIRMYVAILP